MNRIQATLLAALIGACSAALAADPQADANREQRMNDALQSYREGAGRDPSAGPFARAEASTQRGLHRAGAALKHGARKVGHAIGTGAEKTGDAVRRTGDKIKPE